MALQLETLIDTVCARIVAAEPELTALDSAIGDADHGLNMKRGFEAVQADRARLAAQPLPDSLKAAGMTLVMKVGGASGPLYGTLLMTLGKELPPEPARADLVQAFSVAIDSVKARGKSDFGAKTMLDVLGPVHAVLKDAGVGLDKVRSVAAESAEATIPMLAKKGRASFLGERSIGHMDPGARSSQILIEAVCDVLEGSA